MDETDPSLAPIVSAWEESEAIGALLAVRTVCYGETNGAIALVRGRGECWTDLEKEQLQEVATQAGIAIAQAQFKRKIQIHARQQVAIDRLGQAMRRLDAPDRLFQIAVDAVRSALQVTRSSILLLQHSSEADVTTVSIGSDNMVTASGEPLPFAFDLSECRWYRQAVEQAPQALAIANWQQAPFSPEPPFDPNYLPAFAAIPLMGAPTAMLEREEILGFLVLQHHHPRPWLAEELALAESVAGQ
ncbi:GAF domain-containing protein, partial [bacterium]|nr:GAF domain-containing protein [bacterium]